MSPEEFEAAARVLTREGEGVRPEFIHGLMGIKPVPDGDHGRIVQWLTRVCLRYRPELWLSTGQGLLVEAHRTGRARPDGTLAGAEAFAGAGEWADPAPVLMVLEITSYETGTDTGTGTGTDTDTDRRDRVEKPRAYAETDIPVHLLIDRDSREVTVHSSPDGVRYRSVLTVPFGKEVTLPDPVGITLDTEPLKSWVR
ncbi:Uma2 family endonuclease [Streptomyces yaizuensis]|nr:Uma2 family endonuclease [Streptomyces sp. YSPA8]